MKGEFEAAGGRRKAWSRGEERYVVFGGYTLWPWLINVAKAVAAATKSAAKSTVSPSGTIIMLDFTSHTDLAP